MGKTILVTGAASGLGLEFLRSYSEADQGNVVYGIDRQPLPSPESRINIHFMQFDITSAQSLAALQSNLSERPLDLVIHSAGIRGLVPDVEDRHPDNVAACESLEVMTPETIHRTLNINAVGAFALIQALVPNLRKAHDAKVVVMSSRMGSISQNTSGSAYAYRASKAALNAIVKSFSIDIPEVTFVLCHPGRVETKLVRCKEEGAISPEESLEGILPMIDRWGKSDSGKFYDRFGEPIRW